ncbi:MAG: TolC family protein [Flavobacteriales bacterium]|jgi:outer membrane protein TolC|nr:TolC family protein [Flavobacteriales bacterium]MBK9598801.1 TolC family protein [Flavobacteriales bacterium]QQS71788.1 MAG: TolC family protein [Flavobacteriales bacterium]HQV39755.1 TolC family protein [Flavobacteriales bacterium]HQY03921.1 TolC family protein [Flavobacteriales bacterium]
MRRPLTTALLLFSVAAFAQGPVSLSLKQAMDMAAQQSYTVQYSALEAEKADSRIKEILATGLPQVAASGSLNNYLKVPTQVIPNFFGNEPETIEVQFGIPWAVTGAVQLNQLLFDGSYLIGLKATRELKEKAQLDLQKAQHDARAQAAKAYLSVLAAEEGVRLLGEGLPLLEKSDTDAKAMLQQGFMESTDVDRLSIQLADTRNQQRNLQLQANVARAFLALVLGLPSGTPLTLTDPLATLMADPAEKALADQPFTVDQHIEDEQANSQARLSELQMRNEKAAYLPKLNSFINYQQQFNGLEFTPGAGPWYPASLWGLSLNIPIFSSGMRSSRVKQAKIGMKEAEVNRKGTEQRLLTTYLQQQAVLKSAEDNYSTAKANMDLAQRIFERASVKFNEGVGSSFELTQEHANYLTGQQTYIQRMVDLLQARTDMRKALDTY